MERPRVLMVITLAEVGGAQAYVGSLLPGLADHYDVIVAAHGPGPLREAAEAAGARFVSLRHVRRTLSPWRDPLGFLELLALMRRERPQIVHVNSSKAGVLGRLAAAVTRVPVRLFTVHGWAFSASTGVHGWVYRTADRLVRPLTTLTICVSENDRRAGIAARTCDPARTVVIHNAVDVAAAPRARHAGEMPLIITVGRLQAPKDFQTFVRALALLTPTPHAVVVGDGPARQPLQAEIHRLGLELNVQLLGERRDVPELLAGADIFVLSSASEGLPVSIIEAMAAGLPVVASAVGGVPELVVEGETGLLAPPGDVAALAAAIERLAGDRELRLQLGSAARLRAETHFDLRFFHRAHVDLYRRELAVRGLTGRSP